MPYRRYGSRGRGRFRRRRSYRHSGTFGRQRRMLTRLGAFSSGAQELKYSDSNVGNTVVTQTGILFLLNGIAQAVGPTTRTSNKVCLKKLNFRFTIIHSALSTLDANEDAVRVLIFYDLQPNGVAPTVDDVLQDLGIAENQILAYNEMTNRSRFLMIKDKVVTIDLYHPIKVMRMNIKLRNLETTFKAAGSTIGSITTGSLYALVVSSTNPINGARFQAAIRLRFTDCS